MFTKLSVACLLLCAGAADVLAGTVSLSLKNQADEALTEVVGVARGASSEEPVNLLTSQIDAGQSGSIRIDTGEGACLFEITFTFASGKVVTRPDLDVCQTDSIDVN